MIDDELKLGYYTPYDGWTIHITDLDPHSLAAGGGLEDVSLVKKYEISEEVRARERSSPRRDDPPTPERLTHAPFTPPTASSR